MRMEVGTNRSALITLLQRDADDLEFDISKMEARNEEVPRHTLERYKSITRQIKDLEDEKDTTND